MSAATTALIPLLRSLPAASPLGFELNARACLALDLSAANPRLDSFDPLDTARFSAWVDQQITAAGAEYAAGGYGEDRALYRMSEIFAAADGSHRTVHLGIDLWTAAGTTVHSVLDGRIHSVADNAAFGDYGPTVIVEHELGGAPLHILYGHLARPTLRHVRAGQPVTAGEQIGWLGAPDENHGWPPHLHIQLITDLGQGHGDYPGVAFERDRAQALAACPDPNLLLRIRALQAAAR